MECLSLIGYIIFILVLRVMIGEPTVGLPSVVNVYKGEVENNLVFPVKTILMLISLTTLITISRIRRRLYRNNGDTLQEQGNTSTNNK